MRSENNSVVSFHYSVRDATDDATEPFDDSHKRGEEKAKCLGESLQAIHALRSRVLMRAVEAVINGRRLTLMDLARAWPDAPRVRAPLKALDRLLGNGHLHAERESIHAAMVRWLVRSEQPVIGVDWSSLAQPHATQAGRGAR